MATHHVAAYSAYAQTGQYQTLFEGLSAVESSNHYFQLDKGIINAFVKRSIDLTLASLGLLLLMPLLGIIALAILIDNPGPVFYKSERIGKNNQPFWMYKFRTMQVNADAMRDQLRQEAQLEGELFKLKADPRLTRLGALLRATSLDEIPQLFNVLQGEMTLVGPRPLPRDESDYFKGIYTLRFNILPGVTGLWQISGRSNLNFKQMCDLELRYILSRGVLEDLKIIALTVPCILFRRGAC
jgi:lipopolysaccharide/colanic/teichoic acid biosynthesis glycosyltransferase